MGVVEAGRALAVARDFIAHVRERALGQEVMGSLTPGQALIGVVHRELIALMGGTNAGIDLATTPPAVILMAGLQSIPRLQYEVAEVDGASAWQTFKMVTLPQLMPTIFLVLLFRLVLSLNSYDIIQVATNGGPSDATTTLSFQAVQTGFRYFAFGQSGAYCIFLFFVILIISKNLFGRVYRSWS